MTQVVKKSAAGSESDEALLEAIAARKDQHAYEQLFERHQQAVFSLACQITGSKHMAEEAAQEALLKMWTSAALYRGEGTVRSWLLKIVARQSINAIQSIKRARREREENVNEEAITHDAPSERLAVSELAGALRHSLDRLPELERQLIALHYGCGMSQPEISAELGIPQQTVSYKLTQTLGRLRSGLSAAGFAALIPLLDKGGLADALCQTATPPATLHTNVLAKAFKVSARRLRQSVRQSVRRTASAGGSYAPIAAGVALLAGLAAVIALSAGKSAPQSQAQPAITAKTADPAPPEQAPAPPAPNELTHYHWVFDKSSTPKEIVWLSNDYKPEWSPANGGELVATVRAGALLNIPYHGQPFIMQSKGRMLPGRDPYRFGTSIIHNNTLNLRQAWSGSINTSFGGMTITTCCTGKWIIEKINNELLRVEELREAAGEQIFFTFTNQAVHEIDLQFLKPEEIPAEFRNPEALTAKLKVTGSEADIQEVLKKSPQPQAPDPKR